MKNSILIIVAIILSLSLLSCKKESWKPGIPISKENIKIGVVHITDPFSENSGYSYAHQKGIYEMKKNLSLADSQIIYKVHIDDADLISVENAHRELIVHGANIIFSTSWGYMDICEKLAKEFPSVVFAHATGNKYNKTNFTNYFGRVYQARYLSGIVAGLKTKTNKIGFVAAQGNENSEVTGGLNAFALGVEKVNPEARIYVKVTHSWFDPMGEAFAARTLIAEGCDVIAQHSDTSTPMIEAERAGVWGIGYNTDMSVDAAGAVLTSVIWHWNAYYTALVQSVIDGSFTTTPWFGSLKDRVVDLVPLNKKIPFSDETSRILEEERQLIESGAYDVFSGVMKTNKGKSVGIEGKKLTDDEIRSGINWYYHTVVE
ncbi:MAG: BMP family ABC transporter substrate-binding protein [Fibromonadaceae bacterium]|jgi:basic membrane protein A|nr:BMP family ABC transporter substrate-binding protein [Fibromonadaceae bacterium]